jgi:hypothetical protein
MGGCAAHFGMAASARPFSSGRLGEDMLERQSPARLELGSGDPAPLRQARLALESGKEVARLPAVLLLLRPEVVAELVIVGKDVLQQACRLGGVSTLALEDTVRESCARDL